MDVDELIEWLKKEGFDYPSTFEKLKEEQFNGHIFCSASDDDLAKLDPSLKKGPQILLRTLRDKLKKITTETGTSPKPAVPSPAPRPESTSAVPTPTGEGQSGENSQEYKAVKNNFSDITKTIRMTPSALEDMRQKFVEKDWLHPSHKPNEKELVTLVLRRIMKRVSEFRVFVAILRDITGLDLIADKLEEAVQSRSSCAPSAAAVQGIYKQKLFTYTGKESHLVWEDYGIELHFSPSSEVHIEGTVSVLSTDDDNYLFPKNCELFSAVYDISADESFPEPVIVKLQHCAPINSEREALAMSFVIANTAQGPPYKFHPLSGGNFSCGSFRGEIELTHFCMLSVVRWCTRWLFPPITLSAGVYYLQNNIASFVVTKNLAAHISAVKDFYNLALHSLPIPLVISRCSSEVELDIPSDSTWEVIPHTLPPKVDMAVVWDYQPGRAIPQITMDIVCKQEGEQQPMDKYLTVELRGVYEQASFRLMCTHHAGTAALTGSGSTQFSRPSGPASTGTTDVSATGLSYPILNEKFTMPQLTLLEWTQDGSKQELRLIEDIAKNWRKLGSAGLGMREAVLNNLEDRFDDINSCRKVLEKFLQNGSPNFKTPNWGNLIQALEKAEMTVVASTLQEALCTSSGTGVRGGQMPPKCADIPPSVQREVAVTKCFRQFGKPDLSSLMNLVGVAVKNKWREIGSGLGVKETDLDSFQMEEGNKPDAMQHCMRRVFQTWHSAMTSEYSWQNLVCVLESPAVNKKVAVQELYESLCK